MSNPLSTRIQEAADSGKILPSSAANAQTLLEQSHSPLVAEVLNELLDGEHWAEIDNRFFQTLAFGTGGLRGKSIGATLTNAERGTLQALDRPEHPCVGTNAMNYFNISRATQGLVNYILEWHHQGGRAGKPSVVISHDTRYFSREFAELAARVISEKGCDAYLFEAARSTPELSFAVRHFNASAGINITASHNPPQYNGYKVYFDDGAQVVEPHASAIIARVNAVVSEQFEIVPEEQLGRIISIGQEVDALYMDRLATLVLQPEVVKAASTRVVYTPLHGTGGVIIRPMLERLGFQFSTVEAQDVPDGRFPTVKSPNPENAEALALAIQQAEAENANLVIATDPDDDRMGVAVRGRDGKMHLLTGNQIGSLMAWHRTSRLFELGILNESNRANATLIKTFVTTDLQKAIAEHFGIHCVETLTGFKYIGEKLRKYEIEIPAHLRANYRDLSEEQTRALRLEHSTFYVFGGEESYGYSGSDFVRDKDGNSAAVMFAEVSAYAQSQDKTILELLDDIYLQHGFYLERGESLTFDGAEGAAKIKRLVDSYATHPPTQIGDLSVVAVRNFATEDIVDSEGDTVPKEAMLMLELDQHARVAIRPSGTEPKIKYYLFAAEKPLKGKCLEPAELESAKSRVQGFLAQLWQNLQSDVAQRLS